MSLPFDPPFEDYSRPYPDHVRDLSENAAAGAAFRLFDADVAEYEKRDDTYVAIGFAYRLYVVHPSIAWVPRSYSIVYTHAEWERISDQVDDWKRICPADGKAEA